jgi:GxxExxY protein
MKASHGDFVHGGLSARVLGSAIEVHRTLGPGLLENAYRQCLVHQLRLDGMAVKTEVPIHLNYKGCIVEAAYCADLIVDDLVLVELKCVDRVLPVHRAQLATYLNLLDLRVGLLINFNEKRLPDGIRRMTR